ncbi:hypothetical protein AKJ09_05340 [Labilithrix luteola]|uniref:Uncharacterized protein n=1 Tax=Labilithrix luteola TaxID=1391654 RepID=A0A0K1PZ50_9BACT|nr:hypothetical protein [Labilithrix luteola]AKU98676.1 hypothetical protein AKJ09_05340 [Labilithrix luteola]
MGLAERRAVQNFKDNSFPVLKKQIDATCGFDIPFEIAWDKLTVDGFDHVYEQGFTEVYFRPILSAFQSICADDMGKDALKGVLKQVAITNTSENSSPSTGYSFTDGVLKIDLSPVRNIDYTKDRTEKLQALLESKL